MREAFMLAAVLLMTALQATAAPLQVTELRGSVQHGERPVRLLDTLADGASVVLGPAALLVAWDAASDRRFVVAGPGQLTLAASGPVLAGSGSVQMLAPRRAPALPKQQGTVMAGAIMRTAVSAVSPSTAEMLLPLAQADFSWRNRPHLGDWQFRLYDDAGVLLHQANVAELRYRLPPGVVLAPERAYSWQLAWDDGRARVEGPRMLRHTMATQVVTLPAADASKAARLGAALQLRDNAQLREARTLAPELFGEAP